MPEFETDEDRSYFLIRLPVHEKAQQEVTPQVTGQVRRLVTACKDELLRDDLQERLGLSDRKHFRTDYLRPALEAGLIEMTIPDKPRSSKQKYRLTDRGRELVKDEGGKK